MRRIQNLFYFILFLFSLFYLSCCQPSGILLSPPSQIQSIEGHASIRMVGEGGSARSKFSFLFYLPHQARISGTDLLGRAVCEIIVDEEKAVFVLPSKKVYWQGEEEEIIDKFIGFRLTLSEVISLLRGEWDEGRGAGGEKNKEGWNFKRDEAKRIVAGQRGEFRFEIKEFFSKTPFARLIGFENPLSRGSLKVLRLSFNRPLKKDSFSLSFLNGFERKSWEEIQKILGNEN